MNMRLRIHLTACLSSEVCKQFEVWMHASIVLHVTTCISSYHNTILKTCTACICRSALPHLVERVPESWLGAELDPTSGPQTLLLTNRSNSVGVTGSVNLCRNSSTQHLPLSIDASYRENPWYLITDSRCVSPHTCSHTEYSVSGATQRMQILFHCRARSTGEIKKDLKGSNMLGRLSACNMKAVQGHAGISMNSHINMFQKKLPGQIWPHIDWRFIRPCWSKTTLLRVAQFFCGVLNDWGPLPGCQLKDITQEPQFTHTHRCLARASCKSCPSFKRPAERLYIRRTPREFSKFKPRNSGKLKSSSMPLGVWVK